MSLNVIEETFELLKALDETQDPTRAALLEAQVAEREDEIGDLFGYAVTGLDNALLVMCLDRVQAQGVQNELLMTGAGLVTHVIDGTANIRDFAHPLSAPAAVAAAILEALAEG